MDGFKTIDDFRFKDKRVLLRAEFNVPLDKDLKISEDSRIVLTLPTIRRILKDKPKRLVIMAHLGRPKGKRVPEMSLAPVARRLSELLKEPVGLANDCTDKKLPPERVVLLENLRFHDEESKGDPEFARILAGHGDIYVNDAFGVCHRKDASVAHIPSFLPSAAGYLVRDEISGMSSIIDDPKRPYAFLFGASKLDKIDLLERMLERCDHVLMGGAIVFTFHKALGHEVGKSLVDDGNLNLAQRLYAKHKDKIILPEDFVCAPSMDAISPAKICPSGKIPKDLIGLDIGPATVKAFKKALKPCKTVVWNGPMGVFEIDRFGIATEEIGGYLAGLKAKTLVGGGDTVSALKKYSLTGKFTHVSTGGGASLMFIQGEELPGISALKESARRFSAS